VHLLDGNGKGVKGYEDKSVNIFDWRVGGGG
jgi:hypothetical protein